MGAPTRKNLTQNEELVRRKGNVLALWVSNSGLAISSEYKGQGILCDVESIDGVSLGIINERELQTVSKDRSTINDGQEITDFNMVVLANSVKILGGILGQNTNAATSYGVAIDGDQGLQGHLIFYTFNKAGTDLIRTTLIKNLSVKFNEVGAIEDDATYNITFYSKKAEVWAMEGSKTIVAEHWFDNTVVTNVNAPDGALQTFDYGEGNDSYAGATNPTPLDYAGLTGYYQYMFGVWVDGVEVTDSAEISVTIGATDQFTFQNTTPADGAVLLAIYPIDLDSFDIPTWYEALYQAGAAGTNGGGQQSWQAYIPSN